MHWTFDLRFCFIYIVQNVEYVICRIHINGNPRIEEIVSKYNYTIFLKINNLNNKDTKKRLMETLVFSIFLYCAVWWRRRHWSESEFEFWCFRIPWTGGKNNVSILSEFMTRFLPSNSVYHRIFWSHSALRPWRSG